MSMSSPRVLLFSLALALLGLTGVAPAQDARYSDQVFPNIEFQIGLVYGSAVNASTGQVETLELDFYQPVNDTEQARPAIVIVHGGGFIGGDKAAINQRRLGFEFAQRGYVAVSINYRLVSAACNQNPASCPGVTEATTVRDAAHDFKAAVRWLRRNASVYRIDERRIGAVGSSAGAMTIMEAAYAATEGNSGNPGFSSDINGLVDLWGSLRVLTTMQGGETPIQIVHGEQDTVVPFQNALDLDARAGQIGVVHEFFPMVGAGHGPWSRYFDEHLDDTVAFFYEQLALGEVAGLAVRPGSMSPGVLTLDAHGIAGDPIFLFVAPLDANLFYPGFGTICLDPATLFYVFNYRLPLAPRIASQRFDFIVPVGVVGTQYWQLVHLNSQTSGLRWLTNCVRVDY